MFTLMAAIGIDIPTLNRLPADVDKMEGRVHELRTRIRALEDRVGRNEALGVRAMDSIEFLIPQYLSHSHPLPMKGDPRTEGPHPQ